MSVMISNDDVMITKTPNKPNQAAVTQSSGTSFSSDGETDFS